MMNRGNLFTSAFPCFGRTLSFYTLKVDSCAKAWAGLAAGRLCRVVSMSQDVKLFMLTQLKAFRDALTSNPTLRHGKFQPLTPSRDISET